MRNERITCSLTVDEYDNNMLIIKPFTLQDFEYDSVYEFRLPKIYAKDGSIFESQKIKYVTQPHVMYATIKDVKAVLGDIDINDELIIYHIREASRLAEVIVRKAYEKQNIDFSLNDLRLLRGQINEMRDEHWVLWEFVVYKAAYETLTNLYITMATSPDKVKEVLSDLTKEVSYNLNAIKDLLDRFKNKYEDLVKQMYTITNAMWGLRGKLAIPINPNMHAPYYGLNGMGGYNRSYNTTGFGSWRSGYGGGRW